MERVAGMTVLTSGRSIRKQLLKIAARGHVQRRSHSTKRFTNEILAALGSTVKLFIQTSAPRVARGYNCGWADRHSADPRTLRQLLISADLESDTTSIHAQRVIEGKTNGAKLMFDTRLSNKPPHGDHGSRDSGSELRACWRLQL